MSSCSNRDHARPERGSHPLRGAPHRPLPLAANASRASLTRHAAPQSNHHTALLGAPTSPAARPADERAAAAKLRKPLVAASLAQDEGAKALVAAAVAAARGIGSAARVRCGPRSALSPGGARMTNRSAPPAPPAPPAQQRALAPCRAAGRGGGVASCPGGLQLVVHRPGAATPAAAPAAPVLGRWARRPAARQGRRLPKAAARDAPPAPPQRRQTSS
jgi:hypothetical protein